MSTPLVYVVVLNRNGMQDIEECLDSLSASDYPRIEVIVVDNASSDESPDLVESKYPDVHLLRSDVNRGWSGANNLGIREALSSGTDLIWLLNNDVAIEPDCISKMVSVMSDRPHVGIVGPSIYYYGDRDTPWFVGGQVDRQACVSEHTDSLDTFRALPQESRYVSGCALLVRRELFERIGLIDERYFIYFEDADFCMRASRAGYEIDVVPEARMYHKVSAYSGGQQVQSPFQAYYILRSGLLFWRQQFGWWKFHRTFCPQHLGKWLNDVDLQWANSATRERAEAVIDALWYYVSRKRDALSWPHAPAWFRSCIVCRPWLVAELMSLHFAKLFAMPFQRIWSRLR